MFLNEKRKKKLMFWSAELLLLATLIFVFTKIRFVFSPVFTFFQTLFAPFLIAGFLFYLLNPLVKILMKIRIKKFKVKRPLAIAVVFLLMFVYNTIWSVLGILPWNVMIRCQQMCLLKRLVSYRTSSFQQTCRKSRKLLPHVPTYTSS